MNKNTIFIIISLLILNSTIQPVMNKYLFNDNQSDKPLKTTAGNDAACANLNNSSDLLSMLSNLNNKLDTLNQYLTNDAGVIPNKRPYETAAISQPMPVQYDAATLTTVKNDLMNEMNRYDMTMESFVSDSRFKSLPAQAKNEILTELSRRIYSGEIDKTNFIPGFKPDKQ